MYFLGDSTNKLLSEKIAHRLETELHYPEIHIFDDGEKRVRILDEVLGEDVYLLKSTSEPVDSNILETCFLIDAFIRHGARRVSVVMPYLGYMRADHVFREGEAVPLEVIIKMIEGAGAHQFWMIDPHSIKIPEMFVIPVKADSAISLFSEKIKAVAPDMGDVSIVSPDMGGIRRLDLLSEELGGVEKVIINKDRDLETGNVSVAQVKGTVKKICFIVDDIIATGGTVIEAVSSLKKQGAEKVYIMGTHPVFVGDAVKGLENAGAEKVFVTDSIYLSEEKQFKNLEILTLADTIATQIRTWHAEFV